MLLQIVGLFLFLLWNNIPFVCAKALQPCVTLCDPTDCSPGSSVMGFSREEYWSGLLCPSLVSLVVQRLNVCLQCGRPGFVPWARKIPWRRKRQPTPVLLPGKFHGQRSLVGYSPWGGKESDMTEQLHFLFFLSMPFSRVSFPPKEQTDFLCLLHWQVGSLPLAPPVKPKIVKGEQKTSCLSFS